MKKILFVVALLVYSLPAHAGSLVGTWCAGTDCGNEDNLVHIEKGNFYKGKQLPMTFEHHNIHCELIRLNPSDYVGSGCFIGNDNKSLNVYKLSVKVVSSKLHVLITFKGKNILKGIFARFEEENEPD